MSKHIVLIHWEKKDVKSTPSERIQHKLIREGYEPFGSYVGFNISNIHKFYEYEKETIGKIIEHSM